MNMFYSMSPRACPFSLLSEREYIWCPISVSWAGQDRAAGWNEGMKGFSSWQEGSSKELVLGKGIVCSLSPPGCSCWLAPETAPSPSQRKASEAGGAGRVTEA